MQVILAGYNVDKDVLEELKSSGRPRSDVTPETLSASYARISRDPRPINELRQVARQEVEKARKSNSTIIFKMGHHSIAEHAVFNFDILGVSRLALEEIEKFRLCAYTEKSQRYQKLGDDFVMPEEIKGTDNENRFSDTVKQQNAFYHELVGKGIEPEDARYITSLATQGQVGQTINARNLEYLFRRFASHRLAEVKQLGLEMYRLVEPIAPSIILFTEANAYDQQTGVELAQLTSKFNSGAKKAKNEVELVDFSRDADNKLVATLLHASTDLTFKKCLKQAKLMDEPEKLELIKSCFKYAEFYDRARREFEFVDLTYDLVVSAACFGQLKRHRMASLISQPYDPRLGVTIPEAITRAGLAREFEKIVNITNRTYNKLAAGDRSAAQYVLTNAHRRRVLIKVNARELYHVSRLREDKHAQWDIQRIAAGMSAAARKVMPLTMLFIGGKDIYPEVYERQFGQRPKVEPQY
ncbi:MAG: FAD-dependent thymidylate synthase [Candidatus Saganbacteria bacterium]|nr:FAD-dependent thymidylate synthase [Candidatus Saganbacteria bacterium]